MKVEDKERKTKCKKMGCPIKTTGKKSKGQGEVSLELKRGPYYGLFGDLAEKIHVGPYGDVLQLQVRGFVRGKLF